MLPISLITGFLGSGKTTFLEHLSQPQPGRRLLFLVNEFSSVDVDGPRLRHCTDAVVSLPGGSLFCRCLVTEFIRTLRTLSTRADGAQPPFQGLVIEASGMANPKVIESMLRETRLDSIYRLASIITLVDPGSFHKLRITLPNLTDQIEAADTLLLNKTDCHPAPLVEATAAELRLINPRAVLHRTAHARITLDLFPRSPDARNLQGDYAACRDPRFAVIETRLLHPVDLAQLHRTLLECASDVYRAKGTVPTDVGWRRVDYSVSGFATHACKPPTSAQGQLVFLIRAERKVEITELLLAPLQLRSFAAP